tara:strand:+ start:234275 stop:234580 length:306 start_codon:yes stop_codon:yes gene_type:complete
MFIKSCFIAILFSLAVEAQPGLPQWMQPRGAVQSEPRPKKTKQHRCRVVTVKNYKAGFSKRQVTYYKAKNKSNCIKIARAKKIITNPGQVDSKKVTYRWRK